jgi:DNA repair protein RecO (recombination protein O)
MFVDYRTQGFILKKIDRGEADQLFTIFTEDFGKLEVLGKAIRKISSKLRSGAEVFYLSEIEFIQAKAHKTLTDAIAVDKFESIRNDLEKLKIAYKIAEVFDNLVRGQEKDENLWGLFEETLQKLNNHSLPAIHCSLLYYYFFWNLLSILGYEPQLYNCALCQRKLEPQKLFFNSREGGIICQNHDKELKLSKEIGLETVKILRLILKKDWPILAKLKIDKSNTRGVAKSKRALSSFPPSPRSPRGLVGEDEDLSSSTLESLNVITGEYYLYIHNLVAT